MVTRVGQFLRKIRIDHGEILRDMAERLGVSSAFLSAVENGKKRMPEAWLTKLEALYSLDAKQVEELKEAVLETNGIIELDIRNSSTRNRQLAISFARRFDSLDEDTARKISRILNKRKED